MTLYPSGFSQVDVVDIADFWESGQLTITDSAGSSETVGYVIPEDPTPAEDGSGVLDLDTSLTGTYATGDAVLLSPTVVERYADVVEPNGTDHLRIRVPHSLYALLAVGIREQDKGEMVSFEEDGTDYVIRDLLGRSPIQDLNSVLITTDPEGFGGQRTEIDADGLREYEADGTSVGVSLTLNNGLDFLVDTGMGVHVIRMVRWLYDDGSAAAKILAYDDGSLRALVLGTKRGDIVDEVTPALALQSTDSQPDEVIVAAANAGGTSTVKTILDGDGQSDFELATSAGWQNWTPTLTGWSADPTNSVYRYKQIGKLVHIAIRQGTNGTSNATTKSITLPVTAATVTNMVWGATCAAIDNGTILATSSFANVASGGTTVTFDKDLSGPGGWTNPGAHRIRIANFTYEAA